MPQNLSNLDTAGQAKMYMFKGPPGPGKSIASASFPGPVYFFDFDRRMSSVKKMFPNRDDIFYDTYTSYVKYSKQLEEFTVSCPYKTIVIDSITNFVEVTMDYFIKIRGGGTTADQVEEDEDSKKSKTTKKIVRRKGSVELLAIDDYSAETRAISELLINCKYLAEEKGVNIIITCHIITVSTVNIKTKAQSIEKYVLTYGKKAAGKIPTLFDEIYHFSVESPMIVGEDMKYIVNTETTGDDFARSSFHMPKEIDWTNKNFYKIIEPYFSVVKESPMDTSLGANMIRRFNGEIDIAPTVMSPDLIPSEE